MADTIQFSGIKCYTELRNELVKRNGTIGINPTTKATLPRISQLDTVLITSLVAPFVAQALEQATPPYPAAKPEAHPVPTVAYDAGWLGDNSDELEFVWAFGRTTKPTRNMLSWLLMKPPHDPKNYWLGRYDLADKVWSIEPAVEGFNPEWQHNLINDWQRLWNATFLPRPTVGPFLSLEETAAYMGGVYAALIAATSHGRLTSKDGATLTVSGFMATLGDITEQTKKDALEIATAVKDGTKKTIQAASEVAGEVAAGAADLTGDVAGRFFDSFFSNVGIWGLVVVVSYYVAASHGIL